MKLINFIKNHRRPYFNTNDKKSLRLSEIYFSVVEIGFDVDVHTFDWFIWDHSYRVNKKYIHLYDLTEIEFTMKLRKQ